MTDRSSHEISPATQARLEEAGLAQALELFPEDVRVAVATAAQVREAFERLSGVHAA